MDGNITTLFAQQVNADLLKARLSTKYIAEARSLGLCPLSATGVARKHRAMFCLYDHYLQVIKVIKLKSIKRNDSLIT